MLITLILFLTGILCSMLYRKIIILILLSVERMLLSIAYLIKVSLKNMEEGRTLSMYIIALVAVEFATGGLGILAALYIRSLILEYKLMFLNKKTLLFLVSIVVGFFGRKVKVTGTQLITCFSVIMTTILAAIAFYEVGFNNQYGFKFNSLGTNRNVNYILNNQVYFSTFRPSPSGQKASSRNLVDSQNLKCEVVYLNADIDKEKIVKENRNKSGVYRWTNLNTGFIYIGSSINLAKRFKDYFSYSHLTKKNKMIINKAILKYGYANFKLDILEYCAPEECIKREQYYIDTFKPEYNILKVAGSTLGYKHTEETLAIFKERKFTPDHLEKLRAHLISLNQSEEQRLRAKGRMLKLNEAKGIKVEVTDIRTSEITIYNSLRLAAKALSTDLKAMYYNEKLQEERGTSVAFKKHFYIKIKR